jgi:hypothetical protein
MSSVLLTKFWTLCGGAALLYFVIRRDDYSSSGEKWVKIRKMKEQVAFRDPELIEQHKKKLDEMNAKVRKRTE